MIFTLLNGSCLLFVSRRILNAAMNSIADSSFSGDLLSSYLLRGEPLRSDLLGSGPLSAAI